MIIKYRTRKYGRELIKAVVIERETDKSVWVKSVWRGTTTVNRSAKHSGYEQYHDTWAAARSFLLNQAVSACRALEQRLEKAEAALVEINTMVEPE